MKNEQRWNKIKEISGKISEFCIYAIVALVPVFFLPFTPDYFEFNKSILFLTLTTLSFLTWIISLDENKPFSFWKTKFSKTSLIFLGMFLLPTLFSQHFWTSIFGFAVTLSNSIVMMIGLILFSFLVRNIITSRKKIDRIIWIIVITGGIFSLFTTLQYWGIFILKRVNIFRFTTFRTFTTLGYNNVLPLYLTTLLPLILYLRRSDKTRRKSRKYIYLLGSLILYAFILVVRNFWTWPGIVLFPTVGFITWVLLSKSKVKKSKKSFLIIGVFLLIAIFHNIPALEDRVVTTKTDVGGQPSLSLSTSWKILRGQFSSVKNVLLGGGPDTYAYTFSENKPASYSSSDNAGIRFSRTQTQIVDFLSNMGILGLTGWIATGYFMFPIVRKIKTTKHKTNVSFLLEVLTTELIFLYFSTIFFQFTSVIWIFLWLFIGIISVLYLLNFPKEAKKQIVRLPKFFITNKKVEKVIPYALKGLTLMVSGLVIYVFTRIYIGEIYYKMAEISVTQDAQNNSEKIVNNIVSSNYLTDSITNFGLKDDYYSDRAIVAVDLLGYYITAGQNQGDDTATNADREQIKLLATESLVSAINLNKRNVRNYNAAIYVYESFINLGEEGYGTELLGAVNSALELDPNSPKLHHKKGIVLYLVDVDGAVDEIEYAVELDPLYIPAKFDLITVYQNENNFGEAQNQLEEIIEIMEEQGLKELELYSRLLEDLEGFKQGVIPDTYQIGGTEAEINEIEEQLED